MVLGEARFALARALRLERVDRTEQRQKYTFVRPAAPPICLRHVYRLPAARPSRETLRPGSAFRCFGR